MHVHCCMFVCILCFTLKAIRDPTLRMLSRPGALQSALVLGGWLGIAWRLTAIRQNKKAETKARGRRRTSLVKRGDSGSWGYRFFRSTRQTQEMALDPWPAVTLADAAKSGSCGLPGEARTRTPNFNFAKRNENAESLPLTGRSNIRRPDRSGISEARKQRFGRCTPRVVGGIALSTTTSSEDCGASRYRRLRSRIFRMQLHRSGSEPRQVAEKAFKTGRGMISRRAS